MNSPQRIWAGAMALVLLGLHIGTDALGEGLEMERLPGHIVNELEVSPSTNSSDDFSIAAAEERIAANVEFLSSDDLQGRGLGKSGLAIAAHYIANTFASAGLRTDLFNGLPYQNFSVDNMTMLGGSSNNQLKISSNGQPQRQLQLGQEFQPMSVGGNGSIDGSIIFAGYGITASGEGWSYDDYNGIDANGKIVIVLRKEPQQADPDSPFEGTQTSRHALFSSKIANAKQHGAQAILFVNDFVSVTTKSNEQSISLDVLPPFDAAGRPNGNSILPAAFISRAVAQELLQAHDPNLQLLKLEKAIDDTLTPQSIALHSVSMLGAIELVQQKMMASNVIAVQPGRGTLANETIVIGAHYDHVGMGEYGSLAPGVYEIHNGADDNASGTSALLELARQFAARRPQSGVQNYRKIIFAAFSGEEKGLLGSKYYVRHPAHDLAQTVTMINLDMIGRLGSNRVIAYGIGSSPDFGTLVTNHATQVGLTVDLQRPAMGPSDHQPFFEAQIPVLHFFTGIHPQYHRPTDDFEKINTGGIARITDMVYQVVDELAQQEDRPAFAHVPGRANIQIASQEYGALGIHLHGDQALPTISAIQSKGPAERAKLHIGDQLVAVNHRSIDSVSSLQSELRAFMPKQQILLTVSRNQEKLEIPVILGHY